MVSSSSQKRLVNAHEAAMKKQIQGRNLNATMTT